MSDGAAGTGGESLRRHLHLHGSGRRRSGEVLMPVANRAPRERGRRRQGGQPRARRLGSSSGAGRTTMVALLDGLEAKGLVKRHPHPGDRRRNLVELTTSGRRALRKATEASDGAERRFLAPLGETGAVGSAGHSRGQRYSG